MGEPLEKMASCREEAGQPSLVAEAPTACHGCGAALCLRKQVVNLALGNSDPMYCLGCLGAESSQGAEAVLLALKGYVLARRCFAGQWLRYPDRRCCPDPRGCFPDTCFSGQPGAVEGGRERR